MPRAVIVGHSHLLHKINKEDKDALNFYNKIRDSRCKLQGEEAKKLREVVGIPDNRPGNMDDVNKYEDYLKTSIVVISANMGNESIYSGSARYKNQIFIYHSGKIGEGHFDVYN